MRPAVVGGALGLAVMAALPQAHASSCSDRDVSASYADARHAFEEKRYDDSIALLRQVYACDPNPVYLANIARALEEANRPRDAVTAWQNYLRVTVDPEERRRVEGRISALTKNAEEIDRLERERREAEDARRRAEENARLAAANAAKSARPEEHRSVSIGAWITTGVGAAGLLTGVVLGIDALATHSAAQKTTNLVDQAENTNSTAQNEARAANWAFAIGGAIAAAGLTWIVIDLLRPPSAPQPVGVAVGADGVVVRGVFR